MSTAQNMGRPRPLSTRKKFLLILVALFALAALCYLLFRILWLAPNMRLQDANWLQSATREELRDTCHQVLSWAAGNYHDACIYLIDVGDRSSVPLLMGVLESLDATEPESLPDCSLNHCLEALQVITGESLPRRRDAWELLWEKNETAWESR